MSDGSWVGWVSWVVSSHAGELAEMDLKGLRALRPNLPNLPNLPHSPMAPTGWGWCRGALATVAALTIAACDGDRTLVCCDPPPPAPERETSWLTVDALPGEDTLALVDCPADTRLVTGGCVLGGYRGSMQLVASVPEVTEVPADGSPAMLRSWVCEAWLDEGADAGTVTAWVLCEGEP